MRVHKADRLEAGHCNFCTSRHYRVFVVRSERGLEIRFCSDCLDELRVRTRAIGHR